MTIRSKTRISCSFKQAYQNYIKNQIIDKNLQRRPRWSDEYFCEYLAANLKGNTVDAFIYIDLPSSLEATKQVGDKFGEKTLASFVKRGATVSNADSQNRTKKTSDLVENKFTITGKFLDKDGKEVEVENRFFKDLPQRLQDAIWDMDTDILILYGRPYGEHGKIFRGKNNGQYSTSPQENRNSLSTPIAHEIRKMAEKHSESLKRVHTIKKHYNSMKDLEFLAKILASLLPNVTKSMSTLNKDGLDAFYAVGEGRLLTNTVEYKGLDRVKAIVGMVAGCLDESGDDTTKVPDCQLWALVQICEFLYDHQGVIVSHKNVYDAVKSCDQNLFNQSKIQQGKDLNNAIKSFSMNDELKPAEAHKMASSTCKDSQYYWWQRGNQDAPSNRAKRSKAIVERFRSEYLVELVQNKQITTLSNQLNLPIAA
mgnify:CR=1 FL=1